MKESRSDCGESPYIPSNELPHLMREALQEPISALTVVGWSEVLQPLLPQALDS